MLGHSQWLVSMSLHGTNEQCVVSCIMAMCECFTCPVLRNNCMASTFQSDKSMVLVVPDPFSNLRGWGQANARLHL